MPLTAYSTYFKKELDVEQLFRLIGQAPQSVESLKAEALPAELKQWIRDTTECPCCFVTGGDVVKEAISRGSGKPVRQQCFRFSNPGHHPLCDFAGANDANAIPANLVAFGTPRNALTRAVRDLVCAGIHLGAFNASTIRDMRQWFFRIKQFSQFVVSLDPRLPTWAYDLHVARAYARDTLPNSVELSKQISAVAGFDWRAEARRTVCAKYAGALDFLERERMWGRVERWQRISILASRYQGQAAFDPTIIKNEYEATMQLAHFMATNYTPIEKSFSRNKDMERALLAFAALLLFVSQWDLTASANLFATVAASAGKADQDLANVMGLDPFHDYTAWNYLKRLQGAQLPLPESFDLKTEVQQIEDALRRKFA